MIQETFNTINKSIKKLEEKKHTIKELYLHIKIMEGKEYILKTYDNNLDDIFTLVMDYLNLKQNSTIDNLILGISYETYLDKETEYLDILTYEKEGNNYDN